MREGQNRETFPYYNSSFCVSSIPFFGAVIQDQDAPLGDIVDISRAKTDFA